MLYEGQKFSIVTPFDSNFRNIIIERGLEYYLDNKISNFKISNNKCLAIVKGNTSYNVDICFDDKNRIINYSCTCPYHLDDNSYCKHIYATLIKYSEEMHLDGFSKISIDVDNDTYFDDSMINKYKNICKSMECDILDAKNLFSEFDGENEDVNDIINEISHYEEALNEYLNIKAIDLNKNIFIRIIEDQNQLDDLVMDLESLVCDNNDNYQDDNTIRSKEIIEENNTQNKSIYDTWGFDEDYYEDSE